MRQRPSWLVVIIATCLLVTAAYASGPFSVTVEQIGPDEWEYTLCNAPGDAEPWWLDVNWINDFDVAQQPVMDFTVTGSPEAELWSAIEALPFPSWNCSGLEPTPGTCLGGFTICAPEPALYFQVLYQYTSGWPFEPFEQRGDVELVPEPCSLAILFGGFAGAGLAIRRRA